MFSVSELSHSYDGRDVLKKVSFGVPEGNFFIIIGPNGSGKTTLIRLITGMEKITNGSVKIVGLPLQKYTNRELAKILAYVPQNVSINCPFTVSELVYMGRSPHLGILGVGGERDKEITKESMEFTGVDKLENRKIYQLSGGERQMAFIARAICQQPRIIVLDEPTSALDIAHQTKIMDLMEKLIEEKNITIIMVLHDINLAATYSNNLLVIKSGLVIEGGSARKVLTTSTLENAYDCPMFIDYGPFGGILRITPIPRKYRKNTF